jgi:meso-butanediol dehydrogenase/(S,S)-butanediol dehydrogenase/diacetyl reductase
MRLEGKTAVVTGGAAGLGRAICEAYVREGAEVLVADLDLDAAEALASELGDAAAAFRVDVADHDQVVLTVAAAVERFGKLDVMVNNAGIAGDPQPVGEIDLAMWDRQIAVNLNGVFYGCRAAWPHLKETRGAIVNMSSLAGLVGEKGAAHYCAAKGGVVQLTKVCALDGARDGIRANAICPVFIRTKLFEDYADSLGDRDRILPALARAIPLGRIGAPEDVAHAAVYLGSDEASFVTGVALPVDGGALAR